MVAGLWHAPQGCWPIQSREPVAPTGEALPSDSSSSAAELKHSGGVLEEVLVLSSASSTLPVLERSVPKINGYLRKRLVPHGVVSMSQKASGGGAGAVAAIRGSAIDRCHRFWDVFCFVVRRGLEGRQILCKLPRGRCFSSPRAPQRTKAQQVTAVVSTRAGSLGWILHS